MWERTRACWGMVGPVSGRGAVSGRTSPKHVYALILRTCDYMASQGKKDVADGIKLRRMRRESHPGHPGGPRVTGRVLGEGQVRRCDHRSRGGDRSPGTQAASRGCRGKGASQEPAQ